LVAATGYGKTVVTSDIIGKIKSNKTLVIQHRDELTNQNLGTFSRLNPSIATSIVNGDNKDYSGKTIFTMAQTMSREKNLWNLPPIDLCVIDEAHHAASDSYLKILDHAKSLNPNLKIFGVTATPNRGDGKTLGKIWNNCADQVHIGELIMSGLLVPPVTYQIDLGCNDKLKEVRQTMNDFNMQDVEDIMNKQAHNKSVVKHWMDKAGDRKTIIFCSTVAHGISVLDEFMSSNINAELITGETPEAERKEIYENYDYGNTQVLISVMVLTEGFDSQPTSCVILLRPSSYKSTMIQMIGRGLRIVDPDKFPGVDKRDCIVLDFGISSSLHGTLEQEVNLLETDKKPSGTSPHKTCPECLAEVPLASLECPFCEYSFQNKRIQSMGKEIVIDFKMREVDLLKQSPFLWVDLFGQGDTFMATGFDCFAMMLQLNPTTWCAIGRVEGRQAYKLFVGERLHALAVANDFMCKHEQGDSAKKSRTWLQQRPTDKQQKMLNNKFKHDYSMTKYRATALIKWKFYGSLIRDIALIEGRRVA
jgi:superfamily II DNA or RNA helicase